MAVVLFVAAGAVSAWAYPAPYEGPTGYTDCNACHTSVDPGVENWEGSGPHKNYITTTRKCQACHSVHAAPADSILLLPAATITGVCESCHDGTGGLGVYASIEAHGGVVQADHECETTSAIPGGTYALGDPLNCGHCHSVHGANTVEPFLRDGGRALSAEEYVESDCLLRSNVSGAPVGTYAEYGAQWCAACHDRRHSDSVDTINHPVESAFNWGYGDVITTLTLSSLRNPNYDPINELAIGMGRTNAGYSMEPVAEAGDGRVVTRRDPMCQQCHEDVRDVEGIFIGDAYVPNSVDSSNPAFLTFPHQTTGANMLVEPYDDLCLNCHDSASSP